LLLFILLLLISQRLFSAGVVMDQIGNASSHETGAGSTPSHIVTDFAAFQSMAIDDFTVTSSELTITNISILFLAAAGYDAFGEVTVFRLSIFSGPEQAAASLFGDIVSLDLITGAGAAVSRVGTGDGGLVSLDLQVRLPAAGTYWVGVAPVSADAVTGQFRVPKGGAQGAVTPGNSNGKLANPGEGFGVGKLSSVDQDFAYRVTTAVPEPGVAAFGFIGGLAWLARRRRSGRSTAPPA
jgi:hypothetical protein